MLNLLKYEGLRRKRLLIGAALTVLFVECVTLYSIWRGGNWNVLAIVLTAAMVIGGLLLPLLDTVTQYYSDFKQKHGYMLFMTPRSGYRILWAKGLFALVELIAVVILVGACVVLSGFLADRLNNGMITGLLQSMQAEITAQTGSGASLTPMLVSGGFAAMMQLFTQISIAILALTISKALLPGNSYNWLIALVIYFVLAFGVNMVNGLLLTATGLIGDMKMMENSMTNFFGIMTKYMIVGISSYALWSAGFITLSGRLINRGVDL